MAAIKSEALLHMCGIVATSEPMVELASSRGAG